MQITIFTPTYNRANLLPRLYNSLLRQSKKNFEWLVVDDGSTDDTGELFKSWIKENQIVIRYYFVPNGGKQRAINLALKLTSSEAFFIVDSDDYITSDAVEKISQWFSQVKDITEIAGVVGIRVDILGNYLKGKPRISPNDYIDVSYSDRGKYSLDADMAEVYKTNVLKNYSFEVWADEKFTPECVVWDQIAFDGYKLRYYDAKIYYCDYQDGGLTKSSYALYFNNLMGCALGLNMKLKISKNIKEKVMLVLNILVCCFFKQNYSLLLRVNEKFLFFILFPFGILLAIYRYFKIKRPFDKGNI